MPTTPAHSNALAGRHLVRSTDGVTAWVDLDTGQVWPYVAGGDGPDGPPAQPAPLTPEQQAHVDQLISRARQEGRTTGATATRAEIDAYLAEQAAEAERQNMAEVDRLRAERDAARTQAEQAQAQAAADRLAATVERRLLAAGVPDTALARAVRMVTLEPGADDAAIAAEVDALKAEVPALFVATEQAPPGGPTPPPGAPPKPPAGRGGGQTARERAEERMKNRSAQTGFRPTAA